MSSNNRIGILIVDDHPIVRQGLAGIIEKEADMTVVAQASNGTEAIAAYQEHRPDITILDLRMPNTAIEDVVAALLALNSRARIIILTTYDGEEDIYRGLRAGARGYLLKDATPQELLEALRAVHAGHKRISPEVAMKMAERALGNDLSESEMGVLREVARGKTNQQIAQVLSVTEATVKFHINNILIKIGASNRTEAVVMALRSGLIHLD